MSNANNQASARHHFIPREYLDKFADNGRLDVIDRQTGKVRPRQRTDDVANIRGLYTGVMEDGSRDGSLEAAFNHDIEAPGMKIINNMTSVFPYVPRHEERTRLAYYIAFQYVRTLEAKKRFQTDAGLYASIEAFNSANDPDRLKANLASQGRDSSPSAVEKYRKELLGYLNDENLTIVPHSNAWLSSLMPQIDVLAPVLVHRYRWHLFYYDELSLVTSDHPVVLRKIHQDFSGAGFGTADEIMFPLSGSHALMLTTDSTIPEGVNTNATALSAEMLNYFITTGSYLEIYCHPKLTSHFSGKKLGRRPITTMEGGPTDLAELSFMQKYSGILDRDRPHR